jgi:cation:H+ antiporter
MAVAVAVPLFLVSLLATLAAARTFARRLDILGVRFGLSETVIGLLTALAADGPEITSAVAALASGQRAVSAGVVVGSNVFNIAAMIGVSALVAGGVRLSRATLAFEGTVGVLVTLLAVGVLLEVLTPVTGAILLALVLAPYLLLLFSGDRPNAVLPLPTRLSRALASVLATRERERPPGAHLVNHRRQMLLIVWDVALILLGSVGMVRSAVALGEHWGVSGTLIGVLVLGPLTSIPNAQTGVRLGLAARGAALVSETFASNTINLLGGVLVPALLVDIASRSSTERLDLGWLGAITLLCLFGLARGGGIGRRWGGLLVLAYCAFVVFQLTA